MYYVYLLESLKDGSWYIGYTPDLPARRLEKHNSIDAVYREKFLKSKAGRKFLTKQLKYYLVHHVSAR